MNLKEAVAYARGKISAKTLRKLCRKGAAHKGGIECGRNGRTWLLKPQHIDNYFLKNGSGIRSSR